MAQIVTRDRVMDQSLSAIAQWGELWKENARIHSKFPMKSLNDFKLSGFGRAIVLLANGASLEKDIDLIAKSTSDTMVCDKTLGHAILRGIKPTFCLMADANVDYEKYCEPFKDQLSDTILLANVCGNTKWALNAKWKDIYFFCNKDILESEKIYKEISGCPNLIAASSNVSNAMVVIITQCDNEKRQNLFGYDKILLSGFDYSWLKDGNYYAFNSDGNGKHNYMRHITFRLNTGEIAYSSHNLKFSCDWLYSYVKNFGLTVIQCNRKSLCNLPIIGELKDHIGYNYNSNSGDIMIKLEKQREFLQGELNSIIAQQSAIIKDHKNNLRATL